MCREEIMAKERILLAYSGGLDTSIIIPWLKEHYDCDVVAMAGDVGIGVDNETLTQKALACGAEKIYIEDLTSDYIANYIYPTLKSPGNLRRQISSRHLHSPPMHRQAHGRHRQSRKLYRDCPRLHR